MPAGAATTSYTARLLGPDLLERGRANALSCPVYSSGALVAPSSGTVTIYDAAGTAQVSAASVTMAGSIATYSYSPAASLQLGEGWRVEWTLVLATVTHVVRNDAALVRAALYPVITDDDLYRRHRALDPDAADSITTRSSWQDQIDEAWGELQRRLVRAGNRPNLITNPSELRDVHLAMTLELVFLDLASRLNDAYQNLADRYHRQATDAWRDLKLLYDESDDGEADDRTRRRSSVATFWLGSTGRR